MERSESLLRCLIYIIYVKCMVSQVQGSESAGSFCSTSPVSRKRRRPRFPVIFIEIQLSFKPLKIQICGSVIKTQPGSMENLKSYILEKCLSYVHFFLTVIFSGVKTSMIFLKFPFKSDIQIPLST